MVADENTDARITALALAAGRGDQQALTAFIRATQRDVWRLLAHLAGVPSADDLAQETFLRAVTSLPTFAARSSGRTWLLSIARRVAVDQVRMAVRRPRISAGVDWIGAADRTVPSDRDGYEDLVELNVLLDRLSPQRREALVLTQVLGLTYAETADTLHCAVGTVRSRVARARADLLAARDADEGFDCG